MRLIKRRVLINNSDRVSGTPTSFVVQLSPALQNIVAVDWATSSLQNVLVRIDEFTMTGMTTNNAQYWRNICESVNTRYEHTQEAFEEPKSFNRLTIRWIGQTTGSDIGVTTEGIVLELVCWEKV